VSASMLAVSFEQIGPAELLRVGNVARPEPGPGEVRARVRVSGVNPSDWKTRSGAIGRELPGPFQVPNQDGTGVIDRVGEGVDTARVGERVWLYFAAWQRQWGTAAQWTVVPAERAVPLPDNASDELGASLGIPALTAHRCLFADGPIEGRNVLVAGGAGAVGHAAIELARWADARVVTTVSGPEKAEIARAAGADAVVDYHAPDAVEQVRAAAPEGVDRVVEVSLSRNVELDLAVAAPHAVISSYANNGGDEAAVPIRRTMLANHLLRFVFLYTMPAEALRAAVAGVRRRAGGSADHAPVAPVPARGDRRGARRGPGRRGRQGGNRRPVTAWEIPLGVVDRRRSSVITAIDDHAARRSRRAASAPGGGSRPRSTRGPPRSRRGRRRRRRTSAPFRASLAPTSGCSATTSSIAPVNSRRPATLMTSSTRPMTREGAAGVDVSRRRRRGSSRGSAPGSARRKPSSSSHSPSRKPGGSGSRTAIAPCASDATGAPPWSSTAITKPFTGRPSRPAPAGSAGACRGGRPAHLRLPPVVDDYAEQLRRPRQGVAVRALSSDEERAQARAVARARRPAGSSLRIARIAVGAVNISRRDAARRRARTRRRPPPRRACPRTRPSGSLRLRR